MNGGIGTVLISLCSFVFTLFLHKHEYLHKFPNNNLIFVEELWGAHAFLRRHLIRIWRTKDQPLPFGHSDPRKPEARSQKAVFNECEWKGARRTSVWNWSWNWPRNWSRLHSRATGSRHRATCNLYYATSSVCRFLIAKSLSLSFSIIVIIINLSSSFLFFCPLK